MKVNTKILNLEMSQREYAKSSEINLLSRRVDRLIEEVEGRTSSVVVKNEIRLIKEQIKKLEEMFKK